MINKSYATFSGSFVAENNPDRGHLTAQSWSFLWVITISVNQGKFYSMLLYKHFHMRARKTSLSDTLHIKQSTSDNLEWCNQPAVFMLNTEIVFNCIHTQILNNIWQKLFCKHILLWIHISCTNLGSVRSDST